eukprot:15444026-Alexandrium_andersonii.AAC.1
MPAVLAVHAAGAAAGRLAPVSKIGASAKACTTSASCRTSPRMPTAGAAIAISRSRAGSKSCPA